MLSFDTIFDARMATVTASSYRLTEEDVPGASLKGRSPDSLTVPELKRWLACRGARRHGRKPELIQRFVIFWIIIYSIEALLMDFPQLHCKLKDCCVNWHTLT